MRINTMNVVAMLAFFFALAAIAVAAAAVVVLLLLPIIKFNWCTSIEVSLHISWGLRAVK